MIPYIAIVLISLFGLYLWGKWGFIIGAFAGFLLVKVAVHYVLPELEQTYDFGRIGEEGRRMIAEQFYRVHEDEFESLEAFQSQSREEITDRLANGIKEIYDRSCNLNSPYKKHPLDARYSSHRQNFQHASIDWLDQFEDEEEKELMRTFTQFCETEIYENYLTTGI